MVVALPIARTTLLLATLAALAGCSEPPAAHAPPPAEPDAEQLALLNQAHDAATLSESRRLAAHVRGDPATHARDVLLAVEAVRTALDHDLPAPPEALGQLLNLARFTRASRMLPVTADHLVISPDGHRLLTIDNRTLARLWSLDDDSPALPLPATADDVLDAQFSPDGRWLAIQGRESVSLQRLDPPGEPRQFNDGGSFPEHAFTRDGRRVLLNEVDRVSVWNVELGALEAEIKGDEWIIKTAGFTADDRSVVIVSADGTIRIAAADGRGKPRVLRHTTHLASVYLSADATRIAAQWIEDHTVGKAFVRRIDGTDEPTLLHRGDFAADISFNNSGDALLTRYPIEGEIYLQFLGERDSTIDLSCATGESADAAFSGDSQRIFTTCADGALRMYRDSKYGLDDDPVIIHGNADRTDIAGVNHDGSRVLTHKWDGAVQIWRLDERGEPWILPASANSWVDPAFSRAGDMFAVAARVDGLDLWRPDDTAPFARLSAPGHEIDSISFSADGRRIATLDDAGTVRIWTTDGKTDSIELPGPGKPPVGEIHVAEPHAAALPRFSPDGTRVVIGLASGAVYNWPIDRSTPPVILRGHNEKILSVDLLADGRVISAAEDDTIRIWPADGKSSPVVIPGRSPGTHQFSIGQPVLTPDARRIAVVDASATKIELHPTSGVGPMLPFHGQPAPILDAALDVAGTTLAVASSAAIHLWPTDGTTPPQILRPLDASFNTITYTADGRLAAAGRDRVWIWSTDLNAPPLVLDTTSANIELRGDRLFINGSEPALLSLDPRRQLAFACAHVGRNLSRAEWQHFLPGTPYRATCREWPAAPADDESPATSPK
jgi:WD40 repeat protein